MAKKKAAHTCPPGFRDLGIEASDAQPWETSADVHPAADIWLQEMELTPHSAVEWQLEPSFWKPPRITSDINWMVFPDASGEVIVGEEETVCRVRPGDSIFLRPGTRHIEHFPMKRTWVMLSMHFSASVYGGVDLLGLVDFPVHLRGTPGNVFETLARASIREYDTRAPGWRRALETSFTQILLHTLRHHGAAFPRQHASASPTALQRLLPALALVEERLSQPELAVGDLARALDLSEVRLRALFGEHIGQTPVLYIQRRRIETACAHLRDPRRSIKDIAYACGFRDLAFFYRVFRKWMHTTPARWREQRGT